MMLFCTFAPASLLHVAVVKVKASVQSSCLESEFYFHSKSQFFWVWSVVHFSQDVYFIYVLFLSEASLAVDKRAHYNNGKLSDFDRCKMLV